MFDFPEPPTRTNMRYRVHGVVVSTVLHGSLLVALFVVSFSPWWYDAWAAREARAIRIAYSTETEKTRDADEVPPPVRIVSDPGDVTGEMIEKRLDQVIEESETLSDEEKLDRLDRLSDRLTQVSSEASVDTMADAFHVLMGTDGRAEYPAEKPVAGNFDHNTAQFHEITRYPKEEGGWRYLAVLLDADGRTIEVEMNGQDAELAYLTMERIKANPLLNRVYRKMATPMFDQLLSGMREVGDATRQLEEIGEEIEPADDETGKLEEPDDETVDPFADGTAVEAVPRKHDILP